MAAALPSAVQAQPTSQPAMEPGISRALARWRAAHYRDLEYRLSVTLRRKGGDAEAAGKGERGKSDADRLDGRLTLQVSVASPRDLVLDWRPSDPQQVLVDLRINGRAVDSARIEAEHLIIPEAVVRTGKNRIELRFSAPISASGTAVTRFIDNADGNEYLHSLFVPSDASTVFPCFDQPDLKARFVLEASTPDGWQVISNAPLKERLARDGQVRHRFARTEPLSTYQFAFAAGPFAELTEPAGVLPGKPGPVRLYVRQSKLAEARREAPELLRLNRDAMTWLAAYFARRFPFSKYDLVLVPELAYGGMEHAGATFLREESVLFPFEPSATDRLRRAQLLLHETSHQWFGDLVTMRWFDDLWLKEGFANFMAAKATEALLGERLPEVHPWIAFGSLKLAAYRTDATRGTTPIWRELDNLASAKSAYGNIVYSKAPAVLRQAEHYVGERAFRRAVRAFLKQHAYQAAEWGDLVQALEAASGQPMQAWADSWVKRRGMARVRAHPVADATGRVSAIRLVQESLLGEPGLWPMKIEIAALAAGTRKTYSVRLTDSEVRVRTPGLGRVDLIYPNHGDHGYGQFLLDGASREFALQHPQQIDDPLLRSLVFDALWESVREAELPPERYIELALRWLPQEADEVAASVMLSRLRVAYLRYLAPLAREAMAARVEPFIVAQMRTAATVSRRIAYWRALLDMGRGEQSRTLLKALFADREAIPGVPLRSRDRFRIVQSLMARGDERADELLQIQMRNDPSNEGRRYAFAAAAARPQAGIKETYFRRFLDDGALAESWIEEALAPLNDPDHAQLTAPLLRAALEALPRLKRERKIFFVNGWLAAFIDGQSSAEALAEVQRYLAESAVEPDLRLKVLETVDSLERIVRIRARFG